MAKFWNRILLGCSLSVLMAGAVTIGMPLEASCQKNKSRKSAQRVVNTTKAGASIRGYGGPTPLKIYITNNRIDSIVALPNKETPAYFNKVKRSGLLRKWNGLTVEKARAKKVDAVSGATLSSRAVIRNVQAGLK
ncbi:MAG: FMN-binding protein [Muribaculum sp.]|nr:FMN-binding protein [Muribaculum sp.]